MPLPPTPLPPSISISMTATIFMTITAITNLGNALMRHGITSTYPPCMETFQAPIRPSEDTGSPDGQIGA